MTNVAVAAVALALATPALVALAQSAGDPARGHALATRVCADCHAVEAGAPPQSPNKEAPPFASVANTPGITEMALSAFIYTPHHTMPDLVIQPLDARDLIAYIISLRRQPPL